MLGFWACTHRPLGTPVAAPQTAQDLRLRARCPSSVRLCVVVLLSCLFAAFASPSSALLVARLLVYLLAPSSSPIHAHSLDTRPLNIAKEYSNGTAVHPLLQTTSHYRPNITTAQHLHLPLATAPPIMLSSLNILAAIAIASSTVRANAFPAPESFDLSNLNARAALPAVVGSASVPLRRSDLGKRAARRAVENGAFDAFMLSKRGEAAGPEDCGDDEEWVEVWVEDDGSEEEAAPAPAPAPAVEEAPQPEPPTTPSPAPAPAKEEQKPEVAAPEVAPVPLPSPVAVTIPGDLTTPENM